MTGRLYVLLGLVLVSSISVTAQRVIERLAGYSCESLHGLPHAIPGKDLSGVEIAVRYKLTDWFGVGGEVDGHYGLPSEREARELNVMGLAQFSRPGRFCRFAHARVSIGQAKTDGISDTSIAAALGSGIDMPLAPFLSLRMIKGDDVITRDFDRTRHNLRFSTGIVLRF
jgi:hypothetical protein